jgi:hypothetical protein
MKTTLLFSLLILLTAFSCGKETNELEPEAEPQSGNKVVINGITYTYKDKYRLANNVDYIGMGNVQVSYWEISLDISNDDDNATVRFMLNGGPTIKPGKYPVVPKAELIPNDRSKLRLEQVSIASGNNSWLSGATTEHLISGYLDVVSFDKDKEECSLNFSFSGTGYAGKYKGVPMKVTGNYAGKISVISAPK